MKNNVFTIEAYRALLAERAELREAIKPRNERIRELGKEQINTRHYSKPMNNINLDTLVRIAVLSKGVIDYWKTLMCEDKWKEESDKLMLIKEYIYLKVETDKQKIKLDEMNTLADGFPDLVKLQYKEEKRLEKLFPLIHYLK